MYRIHGYATKGGKQGVEGEIRCGETALNKKNRCLLQTKNDVLIAAANVQLSAKNRKLFDKNTIMSTEFPDKDPESTDNPWQTNSIKTVYDNPWIQVSHREVINPAGGSGIYGIVHYKNVAIGIVPLDQEGNTWLVGNTGMRWKCTVGKYRRGEGRLMCRYWSRHNGS